MESLAALSVASNIIQIVEFVGKLITQSHEIYRSADGALENHRILEQAARNLTDLASELHQSDQIRLENATDNVADNQISALSKEAAEISSALVNALNQIRGSKQSKSWQSVSQALRNLMKAKKISALERRLDDVRKQIDTAALVSIRHRLHESPGTEGPTNGPNHAPVLDHLDKRQRDIVDAISARNRISPDEKGAGNFSGQLQSMVQADLELRFAKVMVAGLYSITLKDQIHCIRGAHKSTFSWISSQNRLESAGASSRSFSQWLQGSEGDNLYWITGKPGSGKSTLLKYIMNEDKTKASLQCWSKGSQIVQAACFLSSFNAVQPMSRAELLKSLLFGSINTVLEEEEESMIVQQLFPDRWNQFQVFGGGRHPLSEAELLRAIELLISDESKYFFFVIDGLDEYGGKYSEAIDLVSRAAKCKNVKVCVAGRPSTTFDDAFADYPSLRLEDFTKKDIPAYINARFNQSQQFNRLKRRDSLLAAAIVRKIVQNASGMFLWVTLVVDSLLEGISSGDRMSDLESRLEELPPGLENLFGKLLDRILESGYGQHACQLFRLLNEHHAPTLLSLSFADDEDYNSALSAKIEPLSSDEMSAREDELRRRLVSRCRGFFELYESTSFQTDFRRHHRRPGTENTEVDRSNDFHNLERMKIGYIHRTAKTFLESKTIWGKIMAASSGSEFSPLRHWANGYLFSLKRQHPVAFDAEGDIYAHWEALSWCIEFALRIEQSDGSAPTQYLDEAGRVWNKCAVQLVDASVNDRSRKVMASRNLTEKFAYSFFDIAVLLKLKGYVSSRLENTTRAEAKHALVVAQSISVEMLVSGRGWLEDKPTLLKAMNSPGLNTMLRNHRKRSWRNIFRTGRGSKTA